MLVILHNQQLQLLLCMALLFLHFLQTESHPKQLRQGDIACRYGVGHPPSVAQNADTVSVSLVNTETGRSSMCYEGNVTYYISINSTKSILGFLMVQPPDVTEGRGIFPYLNGFELRDGLVSGFCRNSVSHKCLHKERSRCFLGKHLEIPYYSPPKNLALEFNYSVVFSYTDYVGSTKLTFPPCPEAPTVNSTVNETATNFNQTCNITGFTQPEHIEPVTDLCNSNPKNQSYEEQVITENGIRYFCKINGDPVRKKKCETGCMMGGSLLCCRVKFIEEKIKTFTCEPLDADVEPITKELTVFQERKCECFECSDICPALLERETDFVQGNSDPPESDQNEDYSNYV